MHRLSLFESAAKHGHGQGAYQAAMLHLFGQEELVYGQPTETSSDCHASATTHDKWIRSQGSASRALHLLSIASSHGHAEASRMLAIMLLAGVGVGPSILSR